MFSLFDPRLKDALFNLHHAQAHPVRVVVFRALQIYSLKPQRQRIPRHRVPVPPVTVKGIPYPHGITVRRRQRPLWLATCRTVWDAVVPFRQFPAFVAISGPGGGGLPLDPPCQFFRSSRSPMVATARTFSAISSAMEGFSSHSDFSASRENSTSFPAASTTPRQPRTAS